MRGEEPGNRPLPDLRPDDAAHVRAYAARVGLQYQRARLYGLDEWLARGEDGSMRGGRVQQRGIGAYTLCSSCNNRTGNWYVPELVRWAQWGVKALRELPPAEQEDRDQKQKMAVVRFHGVHPLRLLKQIVTMLLAVNGRGRIHDELAPFVLDKYRVGLPDRYEFYLSLVRGRIARAVGLAAPCRLGSGEVDLLTEVAYTPFSYLMTVDTPRAVLPIGKITQFARFGYDDLCDVELPMVVGFAHTPFPADYRSMAAIEAEAVANAGEWADPPTGGPR